MRRERHPVLPIGVVDKGQVLGHSALVTDGRVRVGDRQFASLHVPGWLTFAPAMSEGSVSYAVGRATRVGLVEQRGLRRSLVEAPMRSTRLLDYIRSTVSRRMRVFWYEGDAVCDVSSFASGWELFDALIALETRNRPHLIEFIDGWFRGGLDWLTDDLAPTTRT